MFKREQARRWGQLSAEKSCPVLPRVLDLPKRANYLIKCMIAWVSDKILVQLYRYSSIKILDLGAAAPY